MYLFIILNNTISFFIKIDHVFLNVKLDKGNCENLSKKEENRNKTIFPTILKKNSITFLFPNFYHFVKFFNL